MHIFHLCSALLDVLVYLNQLSEVCCHLDASMTKFLNLTGWQTVEEYGFEEEDGKVAAFVRLPLSTSHDLQKISQLFVLLLCSQLLYIQQSEFLFNYSYCQMTLQTLSSP